MDSTHLKRPLSIAADLDKFIDWHRARKRNRPARIYITHAQRHILTEHAVDGCTLDTWRDIPLIVLGDA